jgi:SanA protein
LHFKLKKSSLLEKRLWSCAIAVIAAAVLIIMLCAWHVSSKTGPFLYNSVESIPYNDIALILGTSKTEHNVPNDYFAYRIEAAVNLYKKGKVKYLLLSGAVRPAVNYDEISDMRNALLKRGIPGKVILSDPDGHRTLDSIVRAKELFGLKKFTIVSQELHNARAQYIAQYYGLETVAFNAMSPDLFISRCQFEFREAGAKVKMLLDLYILKTRPAVSGKTGLCVPAACIGGKIIQISKTASAPLI